MNQSFRGHSKGLEIHEDYPDDLTFEQSKHGMMTRDIIRMDQIMISMNQNPGQCTVSKFSHRFRPNRSCRENSTVAHFSDIVSINPIDCKRFAATARGIG
jgi:hypothetical protein